jgi:preprotein translocase subunit SecG
MNLLMNLIVAVQIISALVMIGLVLIQHGKGADMGASFGSGASGSLFGATGSANFLSRSTAVCAAVFFTCTLTLAFFANDRGARTGGGSVLQGAGVAAPAASAPATGAALVPGVAGSAVAPAAVVPAPAPAASSGAGAVPSK